MSSKIKKIDLQAECAAKGLSTDGNVSELKNRIKEHKEKGDYILFKEISKSQKPKSFRRFGLNANQFFIQLKLDNAAMYFAHGLIYPLNFEESEIYREKNRKTDYFNANPSSILLSKGVVNDFVESDVLIKVTLTESEISTLYKVEDVTFLNAPLPVSRIIAIFFANDSARKSFLASIEIFPDAFVPIELCQIIPEEIETVSFSNLTPYVSDNGEWKIIIERFDRLMGLISYVRNTAAFYADKTNEYIDYTSGYFSLLSLINSYGGEGGKENAFFRWIIHPENIEIDNKIARYQFQEIIKAVYDGIEFDIDWALKLLEESVEFEQHSYSKEQSTHIMRLLLEYKTLKIDYRSLLSHPLINRNTPITILIFLIKFPSKSLSHSDKQAVKNYFRSSKCVLERSTAESVFAVLGLYYGYKNLVKEDKIDIADPFFNRLAIKNSQIKFKLDSFLDRFTIESIFVFCKHGFERLCDPFEFLKDNIINDTKILSELQLPNRMRNEYIEQSFTKFGKTITKIKKVDLGASFAKEIMTIYEDGITRRDYLHTFIEKYLPELLIIDTSKVAQMIAVQPNNSRFAELRDALEMDKKESKGKTRK